MTTGQSSFKCEKCQDSGFILYERYIEGLPYIFAQECPFCNGGEARTERVRQQAKMPSTLYDATMDDFDWSLYKTDDLTVINTEKKQQIITGFVNQFPEWSKTGKGLYIWSKTRGSGKTFLASAIANTLMKKHAISVRFVSASDLINLDKEQDFDPYADRYTVNGIDKLLRCDLLIIDDLGVGNSGTGWTEDILFRITDKRMNNKMVTIFTSNHPTDELPMSDRITDRINEMTVLISLPECKVRSKKAADEKKKFLESIGIKV